MTTYLLDCGHGGSAADGKSTPTGLSGPSGLREKDVTLELGRRIARRLGAGASLTRSDDRNLSLSRRAELARSRRVDAFVSVHVGEGRSSVWIHPRAGAPSRELGASILRAFRGYGGPTARVDTGDLAILDPARHDPRTAACLVEVGDLGSASGERQLRDPAYLDRIAESIAEGIRGSRYGLRATALDAPTEASAPEASTAEGPARVRELAARLTEGDHGADVEELQRLIGVDGDGDFGPVTRRALGMYLSAGKALDPPDPGALYSKVDVGILTVHEGGNKLVGYIPTYRDGTVVGSSGVTIGIGVDLGQQSEAGLLTMGVPSQLVAKLKPYLGKKRDAAVAELERCPLSLEDNPEDADRLNRAVTVSNFNATAAAFNGSNSSGFESFSALPAEAQTVIADLWYNMGRLPDKAPVFWRQVTHGDWKGALENLDDFTSDPSSWLSIRARQDGVILERAVSRGALPSPGEPASPLAWEGSRVAGRA